MIAHRHVSLVRLAATSLIWLGIFACNGRAPTTEIGPDAATASSTVGPPTVASPTKDGLTPPTEGTTPTATVLPADVFALMATRWPEGGDLLLGGEPGAEFGPAIADLPAGDYLLLGEEEWAVAEIYSLETGATKLLVRAPSGEHRGIQFAIDQAGELVAFQLPGRLWSIFDTASRDGWELGETCNGTPPHRFSPGGGWIGAICEDFIQMADAPFEHVVMEVLSTQEGVGTRIAIPSSPTQRDRPWMAWLNDQIVLISRVWVGGQLGACALSLESLTMYCPPLGLDSMVGYGEYTSSTSITTPFVDFEFAPRAALVPRDCFASNSVCSGVQELPIDEPRLLITTSDREIIWWIEPLGPDPTSEIGVVELGTRTLRQIASLGGDYSSRGPCPDGSCLFLFQFDSEINWRLNLDGNLQVLPFRGDVIIGSFHIP